MTFLKTIVEAALRLLPASVAPDWRARVAFRRELARLAQEPHLLDDVGFRRAAAADEAGRMPWEPVVIRRLGRAGPVRGTGTAEGVAVRG